MLVQFPMGCQAGIPIDGTGGFYAPRSVAVNGSGNVFVVDTGNNRVEKFESFVYGEARLEEHDDGPALVAQVRPRSNSLPYCSGCGSWESSAALESTQK